ncbi:phosphatidate cytidylyltransferase [Eisenibacter elegans]|jgi:phosphatidate cytidylyltransferase|uniref:phosphatidate cytidylyltransferase n=1 Tax=Eisenibacter elegans TaxID=997 RepID=UPI0003F8FE81|nr:phosphatidate cytidylyltransferase [Eisenibacter elegans]
MIISQDSNKAATYQDLKARVVSGVLGFLLMLMAILWDGWSFSLIFLGILILTQLEFYKLVRLAGYTPLRHYGTALGIALYGMMYLVENAYLPTQAYLALYPLFGLVMIFRLYQKSTSNPFGDIGFTLLGIAQVALPLSLIQLIAFETDSTYRPDVVLAILFLIWTHDIAAYFGGRQWGKHPLFLRISPKKTWEGSITGSVACLLMALAFRYIFPALTPWVWMSVALIVIVLGTYGDLVMSMYKRALQIKDVSNAIPGHGGFLDRFDGLLLATPFIVLLLKLLGKV